MDVISQSMLNNKIDHSTINNTEDCVTINNNADYGNKPIIIDLVDDIVDKIVCDNSNKELKIDVNKTNETCCISEITSTRAILSEDVKSGDVLSVSTIDDSCVMLCQANDVGIVSACGIALEDGIDGDIIEIGIDGLVEINVVNKTSLGDFLAVDESDGKATSLGPEYNNIPGTFAVASSLANAGGKVIARLIKCGMI